MVHGDVKIIKYWIEGDDELSYKYYKVLTSMN